jgi:Tol biopolymer transport system component
MSISKSGALCALIFLLVTVPARAAAPEAPGTTFAASASAAGELANGAGAVEFTPVEISSDGRYVAFQSASQNLGAAGPAGAVEGFVKDLDSGAVELVSRADGVGGEVAAAPGITTLQLSADGRHALFTSAATNLGTVLPGEEAGETHVYERDLETGATTLVDRVSGAGGQILARGAEGDSISADGSVVAFTDRVANLEDAAGNHVETAAPVGYVRDLATATTTAVSRASGGAGELGTEPAEGLALASDGDAVTFFTRSENLDPAFSVGQYQLYLRDLATDTTSVLSRNALGESGDSNSFATGFSADGCFLALESSATNLLEPAESGLPSNQTYVLDRCAEPPTIALASRSEAGGLASFSYSSYEAPAITAGGGAVLFAAEFPTSRCCHLYLRDLGTGRTTVLDRASGEAGALADEQVQFFATSASGCRVAFATKATNLGTGAAPDPGDEPTEVYVRQVAPCSGGGDGGSGGGASGSGGSGDGGSGSGCGDDGGSGSAAGSGSGSGCGGGGSGASGSGRSTSGAPATVRSLRIAGGRIVIEADGAATFDLRIRRLIASPRRRWRLVRTGTFATDVAGRATYGLAALGRGTYRLNIHESGTPEGEATVRKVTLAPGGHP